MKGKIYTLNIHSEIYMKTHFEKKLTIFTKSNMLTQLKALLPLD